MRGIMSPERNGSRRAIVECVHECGMPYIKEDNVAGNNVKGPRPQHVSRRSWQRDFFRGRKAFGVWWSTLLQEELKTGSRDARGSHACATESAIHHEQRPHGRTPAQRQLIFCRYGAFFAKQATCVGKPQAKSNLSLSTVGLAGLGLVSARASGNGFDTYWQNRPGLVSRAPGNKPSQSRTWNIEPPKGSKLILITCHTSRQWPLCCGRKGFGRYVN